MKKSDIDMNDDGITAHCDVCNKEQLANEENFSEWQLVILYHSTIYNPAEYGQQCPECSQAKDKAEDEAFERYQEEIRGI